MDNKYYKQWVQMYVKEEDLKFLVEQLGTIWNNYYYLNTMKPNDKEILAKKLSAERVYKQFKDSEACIISVQDRLNEFEGEE